MANVTFEPEYSPRTSWLDRGWFRHPIMQPCCDPAFIQQRSYPEQPAHQTNLISQRAEFSRLSLLMTGQLLVCAPQIGADFHVSLFLGFESKHGDR